MKRFSVKFFVKGSLPFHTDALIPIFHRWIQQHSLPGLLIDVADYRHVHQGPSILLVGHEADYVFDERRGQAGLAVVHKQPEAETFADNLALAFAHLKQASQLLEAEPTLNGLLFDTTQAHITLLDRLKAPNRPEVFAALSGDLQGVAKQVFETEAVQLSSIETDPRKCLLVQVNVA